MAVDYCFAGGVVARYVVVELGEVGGGFGGFVAGHVGKEIEWIGNFVWC